MVDTVGAVYVRVLTDTSGMKDQIEDAAEESGTSGAKSFKRAWAKEFNKSDLFTPLKKSLRKFANETFTPQVSNLLERFYRRSIIAANEMRDGVGLAFRGIRKFIAEATKEVLAFAGVFKLIDFAKLKAIPAATFAFRQMGFAIGDAAREMDKLFRVTSGINRFIVGPVKQIGFALKDSFSGMSKTFGEAGKSAALAFGRALKRNFVTGTFDQEAVRVVTDGAKKLGDSVSRAFKSIAPNFRRVKVPVEVDIDKNQAKQEAAAVSKIIEKEVSKVGNKNLFGGVVRSLRRAGTGGVFDTITNLLASMVSLAKPIGSLFSGLTKVASKAVGAVGGAVTKLGGFLSEFGGIVGKVGGVLTQAGGQIAQFSSLMGKAAGPIGMAAQVAAFGGMILLIAKGITLLGPLVFNILGVFTLFAGALFNTAAAGLVAVPVLTSLGVGIGVAAFAAKDAAGAFGAMVKAISSGDAKDLEAYNEALGKLGKNARETVKAAEPLVKTFRGLQGKLEQSFFDGMADGVSKLQPLLSSLEPILVNIAGAMGNVVDKFIALGSNDRFVMSFTALMLAVEPIINNLGTALSGVFAGLVNFFSVVSGLAVQFSQKLAEVGVKFQEWSGSEAGRSAILTFFTNAYNIAGQVVGIIQTLGGIMMSVFTASQEPLGRNEGFLQRIQTKLDGWKAWVDENADTIKGWLEDAADFAGDVYEALKKIVIKLGEWNTQENRDALKATVDFMGDLAEFAMDAAGALGNVYDKMVDIVNIAKDNFFVRGITGAIGIGGRAASSVINTVTGNNVSRPASANLSNEAKALRRAAGGLVTKPEFSMIGEAGPEMIIPLKRPLHMVDPEVRHITAMLRGQWNIAKSKGGDDRPSKVVNVTQNITPAQADPNAVAMSILNRAAVLARG